ncbi:MAG TPA: betaine-aldehyde dehydrogenase, partial [Turneriella sp.]|nr:betaine-aldehyde dehydrogenase [Turneriella sp.]
MPAKPKKKSAPAKKKTTAAVPAKEIARDIIQFGKAWEYSESLESSSIVKIAPKYNLFINGKFVAPKSGKYFPTINPASRIRL